MQIAERLFEYLKVEGPSFAVRVGAAAALLAAALVIGRLAASITRAAMSRAGASAFSTFIPGSIRAAIVGIGVVMSLDQVGVDVSTLLAGAGVVGLAVGFGSQTVVRDVVTGFFLVVDGALKPGDRVKIGDSVGTIETIGLRMTEIRGDSGELFYVANGTIGTISNRSREWARISVDVQIDHAADLRAALKKLQGILDGFATDLEPAVIDKPEAQAVTELDKEHATVRLVAKVKAAAQAEARLSLLRRVREEYYRAT